MRSSITGRFVLALLALGLLSAVAAGADSIVGGSITATSTVCTGPIFLAAGNTYNTSGNALTNDGLMPINVTWSLWFNNRTDNATYTKFFTSASTNVFSESVNSSSFPGLILPTFVITCMKNTNSVPVTFTLLNSLN